MAMTLKTLDQKLAEVLPFINKEKNPEEGDLKGVKRVFCDGGVIGANPSLHGGTWAFVLTDLEYNILHAGAGMVEPFAYQADTISNNVTELLALAHALTSVPKNAIVTVYTDSQITLRRAVGCRNPKTSWEGIHPELREWATRGVCNLGGSNWILLAGHPTEADLKRGYKIKPKDPARHWPVSRFNVLCDLACAREAVLWRGRRESVVVEHIVAAEPDGDIAQAMRARTGPPKITGEDVVFSSDLDEAVAEFESVTFGETVPLTAIDPLPIPAPAAPSRKAQRAANWRGRQ